MLNRAKIVLSHGIDVCHGERRLQMCLESLSECLSRSAVPLVLVRHVCELQHFSLVRVSQNSARIDSHCWINDLFSLLLRRTIINNTQNIYLNVEVLDTRIFISLFGYFGKGENSNWKTSFQQWKIFSEKVSMYGWNPENMTRITNIPQDGGHVRATSYTSRS